MPGQRLDRPLEHGKGRHGRRRVRSPVLEQRGRIHAFGKLARGLQRIRTLAVDEHRTRRGQRHRRCHRSVEHRLGEQSRDLGHRVLRVGRPAGAFADIAEAQRRRRTRLLRRFGEERRFLRAGDQDRRFALDRIGEPADLIPAQLGMDRRRLLVQRLPERLGVERHRPFTVADQHTPAVTRRGHGWARIVVVHSRFVRPLRSGVFSVSAGDHCRRSLSIRSHNPPGDKIKARPVPARPPVASAASCALSYGLVYRATKAMASDWIE